jgi:hypothetical protein
MYGKCVPIHICRFVRVRSTCIRCIHICSMHSLSALFNPLHLHTSVLISLPSVRFVHSFVRSFDHFVRLFVSIFRSFDRLIVHTFIRLYLRSIVHLFVHSIVPDPSFLRSDVFDWSINRSVVRRSIIRFSSLQSLMGW